MATMTKWEEEKATREKERMKLAKACGKRIHQYLRSLSGTAGGRFRSFIGEFEDRCTQTWLFDELKKELLLDIHVYYGTERKYPIQVQYGPGVKNDNFGLDDESMKDLFDSLEKHIRDAP